MDLNNILNCECSEGLKAIPDDSVDLTITSPPYDSLRSYDGYTFDYKPIAKELYRVTKPGGVVVWVVADGVVNGSETGTSFKQALYFKEECGFNLHDTMIYLRNAVTHPEKYRYYQCFQYMFVFAKGAPKTTNLIRDHKNKTAGKKSTDRFQREKDGTFRERWCFQNKKVRPEYSVRWNVWEMDVGSLIMADDRLWVGHPGVFPLKLAEDHIISWSNKGDIVLDPMCGSGQTLIAAKKQGRNYIGMDISTKYCELSEQRLSLY